MTAGTTDVDRVPGAARVVLPVGIVGTAFPRIQATCRQFGVEFDPWQVGTNRCTLAKRSDGTYAADVVALSISRQVGKTFDVGAIVFALCILDPGTTVVWTAHRFKVSRETFNELRALAKSPKLATHIDYDAITTAAGNETIPFRNDSRIVFAARERGAIRGFSKVRILVLDEAQILSDATMSDLTATQNQAVNPLTILMGTPPKPTDDSEVWTGLRTGALAGESDSVLWIEFSADSNLSHEDKERLAAAFMGDPSSDQFAMAQIAKANPSFPHRTPLRAIVRNRRLLSAASFLREFMGIWDESSSAAPISRLAWDRQCDAASRMVKPLAFGVEIEQDRGSASIGVAGVRVGPFLDGAIHGETVESDEGLAWLVPRCAELAGKYGAPFIVDKVSPAFSIVDDLRAVGCRVVVTDTAQIGTACAGIVDDVKAGLFWHGPQDGLEAARAATRKRVIGDGAFAFGRKASSGPIADLVAVTLARWGALTQSFDVMSSMW